MFSSPEPVTRLRRRLVLDPYSQEYTLADWTDPDRLPIDDAAVGPSSSVLVTDATRQQVDTSVSLYCLADADVEPGDRIVARDRTWEVEGEALAIVNPLTGWRAGREVRLGRVIG